MHSHIMPKQLPNWAEKFGYGNFIHLEHHKEGAARMMQGDKFFREVLSNCWDPQERIEEYAKFGTQVQVICTIPVLFAYWSKPQDGLDISRWLNDDIAKTVQRYPKNYIGLGTIPMQAPEMAVKELERLKSIGLVGIQIGSNIDGTNLSDPSYDVIWETCEKEGLAIMIHPWNMMAKAEMEKYWLPWLVGMPAETSRAACSLIFSGVFDRYPNLKVNLSHAGGSFLPTLGRIEHGFNCRPDLVAVDNPVNPREYVGRFWIDSITHDPMLLEYVLKMQGSKKICLGSDYPFPLGDLEIGAYIEEMDLSEEEKADIYHNATLDWLSLDKSMFE